MPSGKAVFLNFSFSYHHRLTGTRRKERGGCGINEKGTSRLLPGILPKKAAAKFELAFAVKGHACFHLGKTLKLLPVCCINFLQFYDPSF
jgi:hypothetical protein